MNNSSISSAAPTDLVHFYNKLNDTRSVEIQAMISNFIINDFPNIESKCKKEISEHIQLFITKLIEIFVKVWKIEIEKDEKAYFEICDGFEGVLIKKLYNRLFSTTKEEKESDYLFEQQTEKFSFVLPQHLDFQKELIDDRYILAAINNLAMINQYKCPKDKISTIINFSNILSSMIISHHSTSESESMFPGADEVLPIVVYSLLKGSIRKLKSNLNFIKLFRHHTRFDSNKEEYFTTVLQSGVEFIERLNTSTDLNIDRKQLETILEENEANNKKRLLKYIVPERRNVDENYLIYHLTNNNRDTNENSNSNSSNKKNKGSSINNVNQNEIIELLDQCSVIKFNTSTTINKTLLNKNKGIFDIDICKLNKEYFDKDLNDFSIFELEKMVNDFKITLKLTKNYLIMLNKN